VRRRRHFRDLFLGDDGAGGRRSGIDEWRFGRNLHRLRRRADFKLDVDLLVVGGLQREALAIFGLETGSGDGEDIVAGQQELNDPVALSVGAGLLLDAGVVVDHNNNSIGDERPLRIGDASADGGARFLRRSHSSANEGG